MVVRQEAHARGKPQYVLWHPRLRRWWRGTVTRDWTLSLIEAACYARVDAEVMAKRIDPYGALGLRVMSWSAMMDGGVLNPLTEEHAP